MSYREIGNRPENGIFEEKKLENLNKEMKKKILFVCIHNSIRSQMAEGFVNTLAGDRYEAESAGLSAGTLNPFAVEVMKEVGIDISHHYSKGVDDMIDSGKKFDVVITVCDETSAERCPVFPGGGEKLHWGFPDPSGHPGSHEEKMKSYRKVRDMIQAKVKDWCEETA